MYHLDPLLSRYVYVHYVGKLMMLPTDIALIEDPVFRAYVELYASNQAAFFNDFAHGQFLFFSL